MNGQSITGKTGFAKTVVSNENTAEKIGSGDLPVFATPMMIALMEKAACVAIADYLDEEQTSVGTKISISHTAASPVGAVITASAEIISVDGRKIEFKITASDNAGEIGSGTHTRFIIDGDRFMQKAEGRK